MTTDTAYPGEDPRRLLSDTRELARRVRRAQRATWFPLLVLAAVTLVAIPVNRYAGYHAFTCISVPVTEPHGQPGRICTIYSNAQFAYWPIALVLAYAGIAAFYIRRSRAQGVETRIRPYAIAGIIIAVALTGAALWEAHHPSPGGPAGLGGLEHRLASPAVAIGLALLVLARAERNRALLLLTVGYLAVVLLSIGTHRAYGAGSFQAYLPTAINGSVLLLGGIAFALAQRPLRALAP